MAAVAARMGLFTAIAVALCCSTLDTVEARPYTTRLEHVLTAIPQGLTPTLFNSPEKCYLAKASGAIFEITDFDLGLSSGEKAGGWLYMPPGTGPHPAVVILHGCGGLWTPNLNGSHIYDPVTHRGVPKLNFREWSSILFDHGIASFMLDSFQRRGFARFCGRRPDENPDRDDAAASPVWVRVARAFEYLLSRFGPSDSTLEDRFSSPCAGLINPTRLGLLGFSHGTETVLSAVLDPSVHRAWEQMYFHQQPITDPPFYIPTPRPPSLPINLSFAISYYPGERLFGLFGRPDLPLVPNAYMPRLPLLGYSTALWTRWVEVPADGRVTQFVLQEATHGFDEVHMPKGNPGSAWSAQQRAKWEARKVALGLVLERISELKGWLGP
ncbi:hypothetical protein M427DRAFT_73137 [Gonapodya prolifera JEL478]|uniref:Dienelactone hydrolase domain-containing protein n=1 Tax=Gonapodya prolifera (strain JEL478) TaxID=1344416 RepID=A0A139A480_GONPJ|nr:hypothetical protein M427DRAFT_73137 [Gonapodya prolifera JEL478]|eukprot:KXS11163.1 hypothetical protein M427DRAFT_73137 [Gonapodya prolifera JEL478]